MSNMSYCRFENTYNDLQDCWDAWFDDDELSETEKSYKQQLLSLAKEIVENAEL